MQNDLTLNEAQDLAHEAFVYGLPMVENYALMYSDAVASGQFNLITSQSTLYGPENVSVVSPNNDTAYSKAWLDLRAEPMVLNTPIIEESRYWSFQFIDYFTNNFAYVGTRATGPATAEAYYLIAGPDWINPGNLPSNLNVIQSDSQLMFLLGRTQVFGESDEANVAEIQSGYILTPLHVYLETAPPAPAPVINYPPIDAESEASLMFFSFMNLALSWVTLPETDEELMARFARISVGPGLVFNPASFSTEIQQAMADGMTAAYAMVKDVANKGELVNGWKMPKVNMAYFGTTTQDYIFRASVAYKGIYANTPIEAVYPIADNDGTSTQLSGANNYTITFPAGLWPPANYFWSLTMYNDQQFLVANEINRYSISNRTEGVVVGSDGSLEFNLQNLMPASGSSNWLPAPTGTFYVILRVYGPQESMLTEGGYVVPGITLIES